LALPPAAVTNVPFPVAGMVEPDEPADAPEDLLGDALGDVRGEPVGLCVGRGEVVVGSVCAVEDAGVAAPAFAGGSPVPDDVHPAAAKPATPSRASAARPAHSDPFPPRQEEGEEPRRRRLRLRLRAGVRLCAVMAVHIVTSM
jgi:hypothetical protein